MIYLYRGIISRAVAGNVDQKEERVTRIIIHEYSDTHK